MALVLVVRVEVVRVVVYACSLYIYICLSLCVFMQFIESNSIVLPETARYSSCVEISKSEIYLNQMTIQPIGFRGPELLMYERVKLLLTG